MKKSELNNCRICGSKKLTKYLNLGLHPYSNSFLHQKDFLKEKKYPLELLLCSNCSLSQLSIIPDTKNIFSDYDYLSSSSKALTNHYKKLVNEILIRFKINPNDTVLDIGCNDGVLLNHYNNKVLNIVGIEPSNVVDKIRNKKIKIINKFFNYENSFYYKKKFKKPKIITITNVLAQVDNLLNFVKGLKNISDKKTLIIIEFPYSLNMIKSVFFDLIYHEHLSYFNLTSINFLFKKYGFNLIDFKKIDLGASGPALRVYLSVKDSIYKSKFNKIKKQLSIENNWEVKNKKRYFNFKLSVNKKILKLRNIVKRLHNKGYKIGCFTASAKGNTLLNCLKLDKNIIKYVCENNKKKIGKFTPGSHLRIISDKEYIKKKIEYSILLSWNYKNYFLKNSEYKKKGGKFIIPFPKIEIK